MGGSINFSKFGSLSLDRSTELAQLNWLDQLIHQVQLNSCGVHRVHRLWQLFIHSVELPSSVACRRTMMCYRFVDIAFHSTQFLGLWLGKKRLNISLIINKIMLVNKLFFCFEKYHKVLCLLNILICSWCIACRLIVIINWEPVHITPQN